MQADAQPQPLNPHLPPQPHACGVNVQVLGMDVPVNKALAGCLVAAGLVALLAVIRVLSIILGVVPDSIKLAVVSQHTYTASCFPCFTLVVYT